MKQQSLKGLVTRLRICIVAAILVLLSLAIFSFTAKQAGGDLWKQLGIPQTNGTEKIKQSFMRGYFDHYGAVNAKNILTADRAAVAKDLLTYTKKYIGSEAFKKEYERSRMEMKPLAPQLKTARTKEAIQKDMIAESEKNLKEFEARYKAMTPEVQKMLAGSIDQLKKQVEKNKMPNDKLYTDLARFEQNQIDHDQQQYQLALKSWEQNYPADVKPLIKARLQKYLDLAATVDFNAELTQRFNKKVFVNETYERKSSDWKMIFRAGKEVYDVTKVFAEQWISEMK